MQQYREPQRPSSAVSGAGWTHGGGGVYNAAQSAHLVGSVQYGTVTEVQQHDHMIGTQLGANVRSTRWCMGVWELCGWAGGWMGAWVDVHGLAGQTVSASVICELKKLTRICCCCVIHPVTYFVRACSLFCVCGCCFLQ